MTTPGKTRTDKMTGGSLQEALARIRARTGDGSGSPVADDERCTRCGWYPPSHECCYCRDGGRVNVGDGAHPAVILCPECTGKAQRPGPLTPEEMGRKFRIPKKFLECSLATWNPGLYTGPNDPVEAVDTWLRRWPPQVAFLSLLGVAGAGKTHLLVAALKAAYERYGVPGRMYRAEELLGRYRASYAAETALESESSIDNEIERVPLLAIDDLTAAKTTEWAGAKLLAIVNRRYEAEAPTIITGNDFDLDTRTKGRLMDRRSSWYVAFEGKGARVALERHEL